MKLLILANNDVGLYQFRRELLEALSEKAEIFISLPYGPLVDKLTEKGYTFYNTAVDRRGMNPIKDLSLLLNYVKLIKKIKPDAVVTYTVKPNTYGGLACRMTRTPYYENITGLGTAFQKKGFLRSLVVFLYKTALKNAEKVFFENSSNLKTFTDNNIIPESKAFLLNGAGVNLDHYRPAPYPEDNDSIKFLFIGRVMREKGVFELIYAMNKLRSEGMPCELTILGGCEESCEEMLSENEKNGVLKYHGYTNDVRPFIENCHCFVLPSHHEGMANTNLECSAMARPIITSDIPGCREAVIDNKSGFLVTAQNGESLYSAMKRFILLTNSRRQAMGEAAREHIEKNFDKNTVVSQTLKAMNFKEE